MGVCAHLVGSGMVGVVLAVDVAGEAEDGALAGGHPEVGGPSVKDDAERLWGTAQLDVAIILRSVAQVGRCF